MITHYAVVTSGAGFDAIEREFTAVRNSPPGSLKRLDKLRGLSPWSEMQAGNTVTAGRGGDRRDLGSRVQAAIDAMDARGAWVEDGVIGKANRLASVLAAGDLIVTVGGKTIPVKENETVEVFSGPEPPRQRMTICDALRRSGRSDIELYQLPRELEAVVQAGDTAVLQDAFG